LIRSTYEGLFVHFYRWSLWVDGPSGTYNLYFAALSLSGALMLNFFSLLMILELIFGLGLMNLIIEAPEWALVLSAAAFLGLNVLYFRWKHRYKSLIDTQRVGDGSTGTETHKTAIVYMTSSLVLLISLLAALLIFRDRWNL
jgi:hypothetical protein